MYKGILYVEDDYVIVKVYDFACNNVYTMFQLEKDTLHVLFNFKNGDHNAVNINYHDYVLYVAISGTLHSIEVRVHDTTQRLYTGVINGSMFDTTGLCKEIDVPDTVWIL